MGETTGVHDALELDIIRERALQRIRETHVAGRDTRHNRAANLQAIRSVVEGDPHYTWDIPGVERFSIDEILEATASLTGCSRDPAVTTGGGYIAPAATLRGLEAAAAAMATVARRHGTFLLGTGHPGSLLLFAIRLGALIRSWGGTILQPALGAKVAPSLDLAYIEGVAVTTDRASLLHSHGHDAMDQMLAAAGRVDLVIADHGYASGAIRAGVPVIAAMDTNDPALALAKRLGADLIVIPMDDNRPPSCYLPIVESIQELGDYLAPAPRDRARQAKSTEAQRAAREKLQAADRRLAEQLPPSQGLDELVTGLLEGFCDQLLHLQTARSPREPIQTESDPYLELAVHRRLHEALHAAVQRRIQVTDVQLNEDQIAMYLDHGLSAPRDGAAE